MLSDTLRGALVDLLGDDRVLTRPIDLAAFASDASVYRMVPSVVVRPSTVDEVAALLALGRAHGTPLTFRAAGTSLSGQAVTDGVLVDLSRDWRGVDVLDGGRASACSPASSALPSTRRLRPLDAKIGPDPASIEAGMIGGILANNSSGMCCGVAQNSYHTLDSLVAAARRRHDGRHRAARRRRASSAARRPGLHAEPRRPARRDPRDEALAARIRQKFSTKNTSGYRLNAFVDFDRPADILAHLMVGSEGTLGFVAERCPAHRPRAARCATALLYFADLEDAGGVGRCRSRARAPPRSRSSTAPRCAPSRAGRTPCPFAAADGGTPALLVEFRRMDERDAPAVDESGRGRLSRRYRLLEPPRFTTGAAEQAALWHVRKGMFPLAPAPCARRGTPSSSRTWRCPSTGSPRPSSTSQALFERHGVPTTPSSSATRRTATSTS